MARVYPAAKQQSLYDECDTHAVNTLPYPTLPYPTLPYPTLPAEPVEYAVIVASLACCFILPCSG